MFSNFKDSRNHTNLLWTQFKVFKFIMSQNIINIFFIKKNILHLKLKRKRLDLRLITCVFTNFDDDVYMIILTNK